MSVWIVALIAAAVPTGILGQLLRTAQRERDTLRERYRPVRDAREEARRIKIDAEQRAQETRAEAEAVAAATTAQADARAAARIAAAEAAEGAARTATAQLEQELIVLQTETRDTAAKRDAARAELQRLEERLDLLDVGLYRPHFTYEDTESYKRAIDAIRDEQERLIKADAATSGSRSMTLDGNAKKGIALVKKQEKLILRAFNADCEAAIANVSWNNFSTMEARITKSADALARLGGAMQTRITDEYVQARLAELRLVHEAAEKKKAEKELQRQQRAAQREEERVQRELAKVQAAAEKEEVQFERALATARAELEDAALEQRDAMASKIAELERQLAEAHERKERAIAQAQLTKVGHVYIISNHGAFGEGVVKIGMTRRLEPEERIQELGDASVPFPFDLHALIYSEDAPALEYRLHEAFWDHRLNWSNDRKEFFRVELQAVQAKLRELGLGAELQMIAEAREYRETIAARQAIAAGASDPSRGPLPSLEAMGAGARFAIASEDPQRGN